MPVTTADDVRIHFETLGDEADEPLVLIGGGGAQLIDWRDEFCALLVAEGFRVIRFDHRDTGLSQRFGGADAVDGGYSVAEAAADVLRVLDTLGIASAHLAGHSMGGIMAQYLAIDHPERVRSMAIMSAVPGVDPRYLAASEVALATAEPAPLPGLPREEAIEQFVAFQRSMHVTDQYFDEDDERQHAARQIDRGYEPNGFQRHVAALLRAEDRLEQLRSVTAPVTIIHGRLDPQLQPLAAEMMAAAIPGAELHIIEKMGHRLERALWPDYVTLIVGNARRAKEEPFRGGARRTVDHRSSGARRSTESLLPSSPRIPDASAQTEELSGAAAVVRTLELLGIDDIFGIPGGAILPVYDPLLDSSKLRHILVRHEQGAGHAAEGYAASSGRLGVCIATSGPGATNLVTAIADAHMDSVPLLAITGQVFSTLIGTDAFQEADIMGIAMPITKHSFLVKDAEDIPSAIAAAAHLATTGRPGPVLVDITKDAQQAIVPFAWPPKIDLPGYRPVTKTHGKQVQAAARLLVEARKPILYVGGGVIRSKASAELFELAEATGAPVVTTLMARGAFPDSHEQHLGMPGMHGTVPAVLALQEADLIIALGARFDNRVTGTADLFAPGAKVVHVDVDPAEISKIRIADVPIVGDAKDVIVDLVKAYEGARKVIPPDISDWWVYLSGLRADFPLGYAPTADGLLAPQHVIQRIGEITGPEGVFASGVGQHQMWAAQFIKYERPNSWVNSGGAGTMGYSVPAAMGAKVAQPDRHVWAIDGDGCFQMTNRELATCVINNIPIKVAIINNSSLGMVRQWQTLFYDGRYSNTELNTGHDTVRVPDFVKLAEAYGCLGIRVTKEEEVDAAITLALETDDRPVVIDFVVSADAMVWPMVPQGVSNSDIQYAREHSPAFEADH